MAVLLFYLEHRCSTGADSLPTDLSRTSMPMRPRKVVKPAVIRDICFVKPSHGAHTSPTAVNTTHVPFDPRHPDDRTLNEVVKSTLLSNLKEVQPSCGLLQLWTTSTYPAAVPESSISTTDSLNEDRLWNADIFWDPQVSKVRNERFITDPSPSQVQELMEGMTMPPEMISAIEENTRKQASSTLWLALHNGRITSSKFGEIYEGKRTQAQLHW